MTPQVRPLAPPRRQVNGRRRTAAPEGFLLNAPLCGVGWVASYVSVWPESDSPAALASASRWRSRMRSRAIWATRSMSW